MILGAFIKLKLFLRIRIIIKISLINVIEDDSGIMNITVSLGTTQTNMK